MAVHCTIVELLHTSRGNPRVKSPFGGCFWTKLQRPVRTIWKKKRMPSKLKTSKSFLWLEKKRLYTNVNWPKKHQTTIMWHGRFVSCHILFSCLFFLLEWFAQPWRKMIYSFGLATGSPSSALTRGLVDTWVRWGRSVSVSLVVRRSTRRCRRR